MEDVAEAGVWMLHNRPHLEAVLVVKVVPWTATKKDKE